MWTIFVLDEPGHFQRAVGLFHSREAAELWNHRSCVDNEPGGASVAEFAHSYYVEIENLPVE